MSWTSGSNLTVQATTRHYYAAEHYWAARENAQRCSQLEQDLIGVRSTDVPHRAYAVAAILSSAAFLEALVNEVLADADDSNSISRVAGLSPAARNALGLYWSQNEMRETLVKYNEALVVASIPIFDKGAAPYQHVAILMRLRNALIHFKPEWHDDQKVTPLEAQLKGKFAKSKLLPLGDGSPWPIWALAAGGANWAFSLARGFGNAWLDKLGLPHHYEAVVAQADRVAATDASAS